MAFSQEQNTEINRLSSERKAELTLEKLEKRTVSELRARVNIISVSDSVLFAPESNYTPKEKAYIEAIKPQTKWVVAIPEILERAAALELEGLSPVVVTEIIRSSQN